MNYPLEEEKTWNSAAMRAVLSMFVFFRDALSSSASHKLSDIRDVYDALLFKSRQNADFNMQADFINLGGIALTAATAAGVRVDNGEIYEILCSKQHDYGHENIAKFGRDGVLVRMHDKIARLENLTKAGAQPKNETLRDNYIDAIGYCVIGAMWETGEFMLPLTVAETTAERATS